MAECLPSSTPEPICGLCLSVSKVPVMLICWHPFCLKCIENFWHQNSAYNHSCPICMRVATSPDLPVHQSAPVLCDVCVGNKQSAEKTCLTCMASFCAIHIQPHFSTETLRNHKLSEPLENLTKSSCSEHHKLLEMFCKNCKVCICSLCPIFGKHKNHSISIIEQEVEEKKNVVKNILKTLHYKRNLEIHNIKKMEQGIVDVRASAVDSKAWLAGKFTDLRLLIDEEETSAKEVIEKESQCAIEIFDKQIVSCQDRVEVMNSFEEKLRQIEQQSNQVKLLQDVVAAEKEILLHQKPAEELHPVPLTFEKIRKYADHFVETIQSTVRKPLNKRLQEGNINGPRASSYQDPASVVKLKLPEERHLFLRYARSPTLELDSLHPRLKSSEDRQTVSCTWIRKFFCDTPQQFETLWQALSKDSFYAGCHYWELDLLNTGKGWWVGAAYPSIKRKGDTESSRLGWNKASWCIKWFDTECWAFHDGEKKPIRVKSRPERVGVFLDYEAGILSFYDVRQGMQHLYTFHSKFTEPLYPACRLWDGAITFCKLT
ncbi:tripartite motif-containing protein 14 [Protopterus annectens]|uniref:tripartite motif-containing protein 14 n=1 Tax=Protopterus annectens TaxID=7888 RepID=UPI001CFBA188|nr:tripartite motif-containing protein 14 [Protopterus annectens]XP_043916881.1 tripartite motif-containing protein 14 [Protopterus annectens]XP_043916882.1 tripartite motif-containing protein 14 [Protopterus annectens]XP_043916883.1 tripartite motif-containing protein 14 [Protopterus annectens]XP_043916884.1 tripartite motif-containing protein 14 [Protopterus annectens]